MKNGVCERGFPKAFSCNTEWKPNEIYPTYRGLPPDHGGRTVTHKGHVIDNRWVVPYNLFSTLRYDRIPRECQRQGTHGAWFNINKNEISARKLLYADFPEHYTWNSASAQWKPRKAGYTIGRMCTACPSQGERYYLRFLLTQLPGKTNYQDLRTLDDGTECPTFKEAALRLGLLESDTEWD